MHATSVLTDRRYLVSLAAIYAPMDTQQSWSRMVCAGMTEGGCAYFKANHADKVWNEQFGNAASTAGFVAATTTIDDTHQVWKAQTTVFTKGPNDKHAKENTFDVYVLVQLGDDQKWLPGPCARGAGNYPVGETTVPA